MASLAPTAVYTTVLGVGVGVGSGSVGVPVLSSSAHPETATARTRDGTSRFKNIGCTVLRLSAGRWAKASPKALQEPSQPKGQPHPDSRSRILAEIEAARTDSWTGPA